MFARGTRCPVLTQPNRTSGPLEYYCFTVSQCIGLLQSFRYAMSGSEAYGNSSLMTLPVPVD
eukprot:2095906-Rhodomonas_salina.5